MKSEWDETAMKLATDFYLVDRMSYGDIARKLAENGYDFTRNAVLGKLNRSGISDGRTNTSYRPAVKKFAAPKAASIAKPEIKKAKPPAVESQIQYIGPIEAFPPHGGCQYTRHDVQEKGWQMCGHACETKGTGLAKVVLPWCPDHSAMCYAVAKPRAA